MHPEARRALSAHLVPLRAAAKLRQFLFGTSQARREKASDAVFQLVSAYSRKSLVRRVAEVASATTMGVDVDETGDKHKPAGVHDLLAGLRGKIAPDFLYAPVAYAYGNKAEVAARRNYTRSRNQDRLPECGSRW